MDGTKRGVVDTRLNSFRLRRDTLGDKTQFGNCRHGKNRRRRKNGVVTRDLVVAALA